MRTTITSTNKYGETLTAHHYPDLGFWAASVTTHRNGPVAQLTNSTLEQLNAFAARYEMTLPWDGDISECGECQQTFRNYPTPVECACVTEEDRCTCGEELDFVSGKCETCDPTPCLNADSCDECGNTHDADGARLDAEVSR